MLAETALTSAENLPAAQLEHRFATPVLYRPGTHAVQVVLHAGADVSPFASLAVPLASHRTQPPALARLAVPDGQAWHAVLALALENFPAAHVVQPVPEIMLPAAHALQVVTAPPGEYWVGSGHCAHTPAGVVYWPAGHAPRAKDGDDAMNINASVRTAVPSLRRFIFVSHRRCTRLYARFAGRTGRQLKKGSTMHPWRFAAAGPTGRRCMTPSPSPKFVYCVAVSSVVGVIGAAVLLYNESITGNITHMYNMKRHRRPHSSKDRIADPHTLFNHTPLRRRTKSLVGSYGFLDIDDSAWDLKRAIHARQSAKQRGRHYPSGWEYFTNSWEPTTSCDFEERIGSQGDGGKWVCNPQGLRTRCNVISIGSNNDFSFEEALLALNPACNIHTFDHTIAGSATPPASVHFHPFGIGAAPAGRLLTMDGIVRLAGFERKEIDVLKIDCEGCELDVFPDLMGRPIRQILMEVHAGSGVSQYDIDDLLETMGRNRYVIFHKEPNLYCSGNCVEYGFVNLDFA